MSRETWRRAWHEYDLGFWLALTVGLSVAGVAGCGVISASARSSLADPNSPRNLQRRQVEALERAYPAPDGGAP